MGFFTDFFEEKTGVSWDERLVRRGHPAQNPFTYKRPKFGRPVGPILDRVNNLPDDYNVETYGTVEQAAAEDGNEDVFGSGYAEYEQPETGVAAEEVGGDAMVVDTGSGDDDDSEKTIRSTTTSLQNPLIMESAEGVKSPGTSTSSLKRSYDGAGDAEPTGDSVGETRQSKRAKVVVPVVQAPVKQAQAKPVRKPKTLASTNISRSVTNGLVRAATSPLSSPELTAQEKEDAELERMFVDN